MRTNTRISQKLMRLGTLDATQQLTRDFTLPLTTRFETSFDTLDLEPILYFDARTSMLDSGGNQAGFLERVATFDNLTGGPDATHGTDTQRPRALPLIDNKGYLFTSGVSGNNATFDEPILPSLSEFDLEIEFYRSRTGAYECLLAQYTGGATGRAGLQILSNNTIEFFVGAASNIIIRSTATVSVGKHTVRLLRGASSEDSFYYQLFLDGTKVAESSASDSTPILAVNTRLGSLSGSSGNFRGAIMSVTVDSDVDCDFTDTSVAHGASSFDCSTGQVVTINKTGLDPSLLLRRPVLRFDGAATNHSILRGTFAGDVNTAHAFMKFAVNGDTFNTTAPSTLVLYRTAHWLTNAANLYACTYSTATHGRTFIGTSVMTQNGLWDDDNGTIVAEIKVSDGAHHSLINNANKRTDSRAYSLNSNKFSIGGGSTGSQGAIDVEQMVLFDRVVSEADANDLYNHIK